MLRWIAGFAAFVSLSLPAAAQMNSSWQLEAYGLTCDVTLVSQENPGAIGGPIRVGRCAPEMQDLQGWRYGESGDQILLQAGGQDVAYVNWRSNQYWEGWLLVGGDAPITMRRMQGQARATTPGAVAQCKVYYNTGTCAQARDVGTITTGAIETLANMNVRFLSQKNSSRVGMVPAGSCMGVSRCTSSQLSGETWCEVRYDGVRSGWILKEDNATVYGRDGCG